MLRYKTETRPDLVALYDIQPGHGAGQFLQPRARTGQEDDHIWRPDRGLITPLLYLSATLRIEVYWPIPHFHQLVYLLLGGYNFSNKLFNIQ